ncbi:uncharacterized protein EKO05_0005350 [Ascochyta rabiei]|uniref:uncharacterized protein n=1 Tax=Didymella rabiei TaxID=5454 RepID=UPI002208831E|nr:uncharacterized protein EKO05_0005350 [Ascochyta rabiei]UPX14879.1 hypothetical protein EKO05_0005350 [Ascochyta rabiei]
MASYLFCKLHPVNYTEDFRQPRLTEALIFVYQVCTNMPPRCSTCNELASCLRDLATQATEDRKTHTAAQVRLVGSNIELQLHRTRQIQETTRMFSRLERYKRDNGRMRGMLAYLLAENQRQKDMISELEAQNGRKAELARDLACVSALLDLRS